METTELAPATKAVDNSKKRTNRFFVRKIFTPSGTLELAVFEKDITGKRNSYLNYFVTMNRWYPDPQNEGKYVDTNVMNPQDLLIVADFYRAAWDFILEQCNRE